MLGCFEVSAPTSSVGTSCWRSAAKTC